MAKSSISSNVEQTEVMTKGQKLKKKLKKLLIILLILLILLGGFFGGIYLRILDIDKINQSLHLYDWPVIGANFKKPDAAATTGKTQKVDVAGTDKGAQSTGQTAPDAVGQKTAIEQSKPVILTKKQLDEQKKAREDEVKKRISKISRIYTQMDPKKAAAILVNLDNNTIAVILQKMPDNTSAKIMENMDSARSAQLTKTLYNGVVQPTAQQLDTAINAAGQ